MLGTAEEYYFRGLDKAQQGDLRAAIEDYTEAVRLDPAYAKAYCMRAAARAREGNLSAAIQDYTEAIRRDATYLWPRIGETCDRCERALLEPVETCPAPVAARVTSWCPGCAAQFLDGVP